MSESVRMKKLEKGAIVPITFDYVFCNIFNNPDNIIILENFLACYLEVPLNKIRRHVELLHRELVIEHKKEANKQIDLVNMEEAIEKAGAKGIEQSKKEIALGLLKLGIPMEQICEATSLFIEKLQQLG